jgi:hypothetical protein
VPSISIGFWVASTKKGIGPAEPAAFRVELAIAALAFRDELRGAAKRLGYL